MPFQRPGLTDLISRIQADLRSRMPNQKGALLRRSVLAVIARAVGGGFHLQHGHLDYMAGQLMPDTATDWLDRHAGIWDINRKAATFASGDVNFTGTDGNTVPSGTTLQRDDGVRFITQADAAISGGTATASVSAEEAGADGNTDAGVVLSFVSPVAGVDTDATVASGGLDGGADTESDESLRQRLLNRLQEPPHGGADYDYTAWAREVAGVTRAWVFPNNQGVGTVGVTFVRDNEDPIIPDSSEVQTVQDYIDERRPVTANVTVFAPVTVSVDMTISLDPNSVEVQEAVRAELEDLFQREGGPGGSIPLSHINEAISVADGEYDHDLVSPTSDVTTAQNEIPLVGTITWQAL